MIKKLLSFFASLFGFAIIIITITLLLPSFPLTKEGNSDTNNTDNAYIATEQQKTFSVANTQADIYISNIISKTITNSMTEYEKVKAIHDYLIINTSYDTSADIPDSSFSPEGVFENGIAVCQGYAEAFQLLMEALDIDCKVVTGTADNISHAWNVVKVDGQWYQVDVTWDDPIIENQVITGTDNLSYTYFLKPDEIFYQDHTPTSSPPVCSSNTYLYIEQYYNTPYVILDTVNDLPAVFMDYYNNGTTSLTLYFPEDMNPADTDLLTELYKDLYYQTGTEIEFNYYPVERYINYSYITIFVKN